VSLHRFAAIAATFVLALACASPAVAVWHVGKVPFTLALADHTGATWTAEIAQAAADWSQSTVLDITVSARSGRLAVCDGHFGTSYPWAWTTLTYGGGYTKTASIALNDTYLDTATPDQRLHAVCAEIGNAISSDEGCRDRVTGAWFTSPTQQDFDELIAIYGSP
jgi:hypothetical protein